MIQWKKLKNGLAVLLAVTMVGQPVGVYAEDFTSEAEVESYAEEETDTQLETEDEESGEDFSSEDEVETGLDEAEETDEISVEDADSIGDGSSETEVEEVEQPDVGVGGIMGNLWYSWDGKSRLLIGGTGDMWDFDISGKSAAPWVRDRLPIKKVIIKEGVTSVGNNAFYGCTELEEIEMPSVKSIGEWAFRECYNLETLEMPLVETIGYAAFNTLGKNTTKVETLDLPNVKTIDSWAFSGFGNLKTLKLPKVESIDSTAFYSTICSLDKLEVLEIPSMKSVEEDTFSGCSKLETLEMPEVESIGWGAFRSCSNLKTLKMPKVTTIEGGAFSGCKSLNELDMPVVTTIGFNAFGGCESLNEVDMPVVTTIEGDAFKGCKSLNEVDLSVVTTIGKQAFYENNFTKIVLPSTLTEIGAEAFSNDSYRSPLKTVFFRGGVLDSIDEDAFKNMRDTTFYYPVNKGWTEDICTSNAFGSRDSKWVAYDRVVPGKYVFNNDGTCSSDGTETAECICGCGETDTRTAKNTKNPDNHTYSEDCYKELSNGKKVYYCKGCGRIQGEPEEKGTCGDSLTWEIYDSDVLCITGTGAMADYDIDNPAPWSGKNIRYCRLGKGITSVGASAFENCTSLEIIELEEGITSINGYAFYGCTSLKELELPKSLKSIGENAFEGCTSLQKVTAYPKLTSLKNTSFRKCSALTIRGYEGSYIQEYATEKEIPFESMGKWGTCGYSAEWYLIDGTLTISGYYDMTDYSETNKAPWAGLNVTKIVVENISTIGNYAFADLSEVTEITLSNTVHEIGDYAFKNCAGLKSIEIPDSLELGIISEGMFYGCTSLETIKLPDNIQKIENLAFANCKSLSSFTVPEEVTIIKHGTFLNCESLSNITLGNKITAIESSAFAGCGLTEIQLPSGIMSFGEEAFAKNKFTGFTIPSDVTELGVNVFAGCDQLQEISVEEGNANFSAAGGVLYDKAGTKLLLCPGGKEGTFTLPRRTTEIAESAFKGCKKITELVLPSGLTTIRSKAFSGMNLTTVELPAELMNLSPNAFAYCSKLTEITVDEDNTVFAAVDGVLCDKNKEKVLICPPGLDRIVLSEGIKSIEKDAIAVRREETVIDLPFSLKKIDFSNVSQKSVVFEAYGNARIVYDLDWMGYNWRSKGNHDLPWEGDTSTEYHKAMAYEKLTEYLFKSPNQTITKKNGTLTHVSTAINFTHVTSTGSATGTMKFRITPNGVEDNKFTLEVKTSGSNGSLYGFTATLTVDPAKLTSKTADYNYTWDIQKGAYCTTTTRNINSMANSALYNGVACLCTELLPETGTGLKIKDLGFLGMFKDSTIHTFEVEEGKDATCTENGYGASAWCPLCGAVQIRGSVIPATGHAYGDWVVTEEATCTKDGTETSTCANCGDVKTNVIEKKGHTEEILPSSAATCERPGVTEGIRCSVCGEILKEQTETEPATGHAYGDWVVTEEATCAKEGTETSTCANCGDVKTRTVKKKAHTEEIIPGKAPTCEEPGLTEGIRCSVCGEVLKEQKTEGEATGHNFGEYKTTKAATALDTGVKTRTCGVCGKEEIITIPKLKATIKLNVTSIVLKVGRSTTKVKVSGLAKGDAVASWKTGNTKLVKVTNSGKITAGKKPGSTTITVKLKSGKKATIKVKVQKGEVKTTRITGVPSKSTIKAGKRLTLKPVISPITSVQKITYATSNKNIAIVSSKGVITGKKPGKAKITVKSGTKKSEITVTVKK